MNATFRKWFLGLISVAVTSAANTVVVSVVDPTTFNLEHGLPKLGEVCGATVLLHVAMYLQKSPIWGNGKDSQ